MPKWIWNALNGKSIDVYGDGTQTRDFTFVGTVVDILEQAVINKVLSNDAVNVAYGNNISLLEIIQNLRIYFPDLNCNFLEKELGILNIRKMIQRLLHNYFPLLNQLIFQLGYR